MHTWGAELLYSVSSVIQGAPGSCQSSLSGHDGPARAGTIQRRDRRPEGGAAWDDDVGSEWGSECSGSETGRERKLTPGRHEKKKKNTDNATLLFTLRCSLSFFYDTKRGF